MQKFPIFNQIGIVPRWTIFFCDLTIAAIAFVFAYAVFYSFNLNAYSRVNFAVEMIHCLTITSISFFVFRLYSGIVRYTSAVDSIRILSTLLFNIIILFAIKLIFIALRIPSVLPTNLIIIYSLFAFTGLTTYRTLIKIFFQYSKTRGADKKNIAVFGAGDLGIAVKRTFDHDSKSNKVIVAYLDDSDSKIGKSIDGVKIYDSASLNDLIDKLAIDELIFATHNLSLERKEQIVETCLDKNVNALTLPPVNEIINGNITVSQIKKVKIEDLLERAPIKLSHENILDQLEGKRILVTGAAGSIGSEIAKQLGKFKPQLIILCDQAESPLHNLHLDLQDRFKHQAYHSFIADVKNEERMRTLFETFKPQYVYHAAAYKHVPVMENHPVEGVQTNIRGTFTLANLAVEYGVSKFVFVSTDKAVNPTNVMGATKRIAEIYVQSLNNRIFEQNNEFKTRFITTRFGNVLGSNGSVIPRFREQIEKGGPLTVTHPEITRYFMTIPESCQLVIEAGCMGNGGEIFVFDMGKSVKIVDLAEKMIKLSGFTPYQDIDIKFTGLRPGEKLYEELLNDLENTLPTHHQKIMIAKVRDNNFDEVCALIDRLFEIAKSNNSLDIVRQMKCIVPEFKSQNSIYEQLDVERTPTTN
ncbi:polysaccharide biosynthesis protein [Sphingobacterium psychroaquaticum]|uniref:NDP-sugar epimerase, includes UDP-GlcNAc-inverting 4,6-dehydratase FlaA1 and capsular polysaccharide biosynthesis protein EpsC n=1 Tax=Sphingobacterium psychroaquaticum TaxID=561061 RepID=A0A1X7K2M4_9SPHI|nr:nucleoside-diphosphate sugar epimerase/dehydratase [Sphingobacterium psychroaquaticum]QBQ42603.1 polysaccharide biosynthesis protein [Sphingobacterium psychroaquaticum]SMG35229.1 NDP-sugar epimerase, includes UDP-GlcNAc-inverting 4,6-dehydratase FlaA1 and capsular polysaccharide biosynthesis protein EpsC [Sphingobacterium psychroaquaticum]